MFVMLYHCLRDLLAIKFFSKGFNFDRFLNHFLAFSRSNQTKLKISVTLRHPKTEGLNIETIMHNTDQKFPPELKTWLFAQGSLTQQLTDVAGGIFKVQPTQEHYQRMTLLDSQWMSMPHQHTSWVRESYLFGCDAQPWVKAKVSFLF